MTLGTHWLASALVTAALIAASGPVQAQEKRPEQQEHVDRSTILKELLKDRVTKPAGSDRKDLLPPRTERLDEIAGVPGFASRIIVGRGEITGHNQYGTAGFFLEETWSEASRVAAKLCSTRGFVAGHFNGQQDAVGSMELLCTGPGAIWRDATLAEIASSPFPFTEVNQVSWAQAGRAAAHLCAAAKAGFAGGQFNGHQLNGRYGLFCYRDGAVWFDATGPELGTSWGFAPPKLDDVPWAQASRAATHFCQARGFDGGFLNGHQLPNKFGIVCQK